jgi:hypothetical protein
MIRWEEQPDGSWLGYSGQALVATATKVDEKRWDWDVPGAGKPKGWRNSGHRTNELDARRAADAYWDKWLRAAALKPDLGRLAETSVPSKPRAQQKTEKTSAATAPESRRAALDLEAANAKLEDVQRKLDRAEARASKAEERATAAEARADVSEKSAKERLARLREVLGE